MTGRSIHKIVLWIFTVFNANLSRRSEKHQQQNITGSGDLPYTISTVTFI